MTIIQAETQQKQRVNIEAREITQRFSVYGLLQRRNKILLVKTHSDNWELPGGTPEPGETLQQTLARELEEEVGISILVGGLFYMRESFYHTPSNKTYHSLQLYFYIESNDAARAAEAKAFAFVPIKDLTEKTTNTSTFLALQSIKKGKLYDPWVPIDGAVNSLGNGRFA